MKNKKIAALAAMAMVVLLAACGIRSEQSVTSGEMVVPEVSSEDLLVSSLEYLLLNNTDENTPDEQTPQDEEIQGETAVIYYGNGGSSSLQQETAAVESITPEELVGALARHNIVSLDTKVLSFGQEEQDDATVLHLDMSKAAGVYLRTMSKEAECIIVAAITNTFLENFGADAICLTVEGEPLTTSNMEYTEPLRVCTPDELSELMKASDADGEETELKSDSSEETESKLPGEEENKN